MSEQPTEDRRWYQKKRYIIPATLIALSVLFGGGSAEQSVSTVPSTSAAREIVLPAPTITPVTTQVAPTAKSAVTQSAAAVQATTNTGGSLASPPTETKKPATTETETNTASTLSNDNYYTNVDGNEVHSPAYSSGGIPAGASAKCRDGTYSFSQNRRGTCSHHGGVATWY